MSTAFEDRLRSAREARSLTQTELAKKCKWVASVVAHLEGGRRKPSFETLAKLADALNVSTDYLMGRSTELSGGGTPQFHGVDALSSSDIEFVQQIIDIRR